MHHAYTHHLYIDVYFCNIQPIQPLAETLLNFIKWTMKSIIYEFIYL